MFVKIFPEKKEKSKTWRASVKCWELENEGLFKK